MKPKDVVYCGINARLLLHSTYQRFECPLSTTTAKEVALGFAARSESVQKGIILTLKRANPKTKYFDVASFSFHKNEKEWLVMGSTLKIIDIWLLVDGQWQFYTTTMAALLMFEQMINGRYVDGNKKARSELRKMLQRATKQSVTDTLRTSCDSDEQRLYIFLSDEGFDTDAILKDIDETDCSNIGQFMSDRVSTEKITSSIHKTYSMYSLWEIQINKIFSSFSLIFRDIIE